MSSERYKKVFRLLLQAFAGVLVAFMALSACSCGTASFSSEMKTEMEKAVDEVMVKDNIPGAIVGVWVPGKGEWIAASGVADVETDRKIEVDDNVRIASNTKPFTATVILQLVDEGKLSLDDKLEKYVPGIPYGDEITIRQVCNMTSGTYSFTEDEEFDREFTENPLMEIAPQQEVDIALKHDSYFPPGEGWHYSDTNYIILGMIIDKVTGNKAADEIDTRIIEPLKLENTSMPDKPEIPGKHSKGYVDMEGEGLVDYTSLNPSIAWTGGGMVSSLDDMKIWAKALADGDLVSKEMHEEQFDWVDTGSGTMKYGLGVTDIHGFIGHHGAIFGFNSVFFYLPEEDATLVVFTNNSTNASGESTDIVLELIKIIYPERMP